jgi:hypothetical protein
MTPRLNKLLAICPYFGGLAWLLLLMRTRDFSLKWAVVAYLWPLLGLAMILPLVAVSTLWDNGGEMGTMFTLLLFFIVAGILGEAVIWPLRVIHTVRYEGRQSDEVHPEESRSNGTAVETATPSGQVRKDPVREIGPPSASSGASVASRGGGFRRALAYVGIGIAAFGVGVAAAEAVDQTLGRRKGGFQPGKILAAGGQAMLGATAVILFVIFYPFFYLGSAAWHAYLDESVLTLTMHDQRRIQIVYSSFFPEYQLAVLADARGCIYLFDLPREHLAQVRSVEHGLIFGGETEISTACVPDLKEAMEYNERVDSVAARIDKGVLRVGGLVSGISGSSRRIGVARDLRELGLSGDPVASGAETVPRLELHQLTRTGHVSATDRHTGARIEFDIAPHEVVEIVDSATSRDGRLLAVTIKRAREKTVWRQFFGDCTIYNFDGANHDAYCDVSTEIWDLSRQRLIRSLSWPSGIESIKFVGNDDQLIVVAYDHSEIFGGTSLKLWPI